LEEKLTGPAEAQTGKVLPLPISVYKLAFINTYWYTC